MTQTVSKIDKVKLAGKNALLIVKISKIISIILASFLFITGCIFIGMQGKLNQAIQLAVDEGYMNYDNMTQMVRFPAIREIIKSDNLADGLGAYLIVGAVLLTMLAVIFHFLGKVFKEFTDSYSPFQPQIIKNMKIVFVMITILSLNVSILVGTVTGISLWCVIQIFEYGCELQKQSDETL